ncbi:MAG: hypothetical protein RBT69_08245 [Spirochaetia bacterium]|jgi:signal transduction histidine kinase|nr:hypothetical protein [Spirochaetia bacterium]
MSGIYGYIDLAIETCKDPGIINYLSKAMGGMERTKELTGKLLTFAKESAPDLKIIQIFPLINEFAETSLKGSDISCQFEKSDNLWSCRIVQIQIKRGIGHIIKNSKQAMDRAGKIKI